MKDKLFVSTLIMLFLSVSFNVPVGIVTVCNVTESLTPEVQYELAQAPMVLIDESHLPGSDFTHDNGLANLTSDIEDYGYSVENMTSWSESMLFSADVVIIPVPLLTYSWDEYYILERFVAKGGGLFIIGDNPSGSMADELAEMFDFSFTTDYFEDNDDYIDNPFWIRWDRVSNFGNHPITEGISNVTTYLGYGIRRYPGLGVPILMMDADDNSEYSSGFLSCGTAAMVAIEYPTGIGRIVVTGDVHQFGAGDLTGNGINEYYEADNDLLARNIIDWLANTPIPDNVIVFDETHLPYARIWTLAQHFNVLFEETQNPMWGMATDYLDLSSYLEGNYIDTERMTLWDPVDLSSAEVIVLANPSTTYSESDYSYLMSLVRGGRGLLLIGEAGQFLGAGAAQIAGLFGAEFYDGGLNDTDDYYDIPNRIIMDGSNLADHPSLNGVHEVGYIYGGGFRTVPDDAVAILSSDDDSSSGWTQEPPGSESPRNVPCAIAFQYGEGRVMMIADGNLFTNPPIDQFLEKGNNSLFAISAIRWLAEGDSLGNYWYGAQALRDQGYGVMSMKQFNATFLEGTDALILPAPTNPYSAAEKAVIEDYVTVQGNGLFLISEKLNNGDAIRDIASDYGILFDDPGLELEDEDDAAHTANHELFLLDEFNIQTHAITEGVEGLLWARGTGIGGYPEDTEVILQMDDDAYSEWSNGTPALQVAMMVALESGNGRIVALGDSTFWDGTVMSMDNYGDMDTMSVHELDNSRIMLNTVDWLIRGEGPIIPFNLPWWALPAIGVVIVVVVLGIGFSRRSRKTKTTGKKGKTKKKQKSKSKKE
jgi:hypothetical protein